MPLPQEPHTGYAQRGKDFDLVFADNVNTEQYWEYLEEHPEDADAFPRWVEKWKDFREWTILDFLDEQNFAWMNTDTELTLITKSGNVINSRYYGTLKEFLAAAKPFSENHFSAAIFNDFGYETFWVNGWDGAVALQAYTGWFDFDIYEDWI